ncbi:ubiquitin-associated domain-containing protein 1-like isoform X2 [Liolophura sinensis]|uniref:ubiquitin-associated domain-containing protein 1-like isoform X2 n=1 Tax=Liolophura sinensis TaxID=3198878 RepID=UPI0031588098
MLVTGNTIFQPSNMRVRITSMRGVDFICELCPDMTVHEVKVKSLGHFLGPGESVKESLYHRLILVRTGKVLNDEASVKHEELEENDELLLIKRRIQPLPFEVEKREESGKAPTLEQIREATANIPCLNHDRPPEDPPNSVHFQAELRKILISLIEASQKILCLDPEAAKIFKQADEIMNENSADKTKIDKASLQQLVDMGFPEVKARKALKLNRMNVMEAMEWLFQHESDPDTEVTVSTEEQEPVSEEGAVGGSDPAEGEPSHVNKLLENFRAFRRREFKPNSRSLQNLVEMGFDEKEAIDALRVSGNNQDAACDWLLSETRPVPDDLDQGLDTSGPIYQAIMANPTVQLGLNNPRSLLAFLQMLDNPFSTSQWLSDPETGPMLVQISRIYHAEKNSNKSQANSVPVSR